MILTVFGWISYDKRVGRVALITVILFLPMLSINAFARCAPDRSPVLPVVSQLSDDMAVIFQHLGSIAKAPEVAATIQTDDDKMIIPGMRAGVFHLDTKLAQLQAKGTLEIVSTKDLARYSDILPLGYIPERTFRRLSAHRLRFAFSLPELKLREILVRDPDYQTADHLRVGGPADGLKDRKGLKARKGKDGLFYYQGNGITFVANGSKILEIIVIHQP
jgi:hypothetical protein